MAIPIRRPSKPRPGRLDRDRDRGAALIVAIAFMVMIGLMAAGLTSMVTSGLENRLTLDRLRDRHYAVDGALEDAISGTRAEIDSGMVGCGDTSSTSSTLNGITIRVDVEIGCIAVPGADQLPVGQFAGRYTACIDAATACEDADAIVQAIVGFEIDPSGSVAATAVRSWSVTP